MQNISDEYLRGILPVLLPGIIIEKKFAVSGQRVVYLARFEAPGKEPFLSFGRCVVKVSSALSPKQIAYLQREIDILNSISSHYYPKLFFNDVFSEDPSKEEKLPTRLFVTIEEYIESKPLSECAHQFRNEKACAELLLKLISALSLLWKHKNKLIHRDIKPANILIRPNGDIVIIDLGILREEGEAGLTSAGLPFGPCTPCYASPEQALNDKLNISFRSDFFSLGILAYELCSGTNPFMEGASTRDDVLENVCKLIPKSLASMQKAGSLFSGIVERLLEKQPYKRYRTIEKLTADLQECIRSLQ